MAAAAPIFLFHLPPFIISHSLLTFLFRRVEVSRRAIRPMIYPCDPGILGPTHSLLVLRAGHAGVGRHLHNEQGQNPQSGIRKYFYYIDHQGMLFLDDTRMKNFTSCFKEKKFLQFFFSRMKFNETGRYPEFPFLSLCGCERNYIRCDDLPLVFTHLVSGLAEASLV
ncbi:UPF0598 protein C8orf82 homolog [Portunus trituberculatus]|uniref:UPF0598 protein C8orf82 homolog n=1 Tax=Portunus trituberculatus TaxID=210409 RepID=UPI001E1CE379|nr:UPF0598 protein C8orf82 homolog [Portunus trituberculatus]